MTKQVAIIETVEEKKARLYAEVEAHTPGYITSRQAAKTEREARHAEKMEALRKAGEEAEAEIARLEAQEQAPVETAEPVEEVTTIERPTTTFIGPDGQTEILDRHNPDSCDCEASHTREIDDMNQQNSPFGTAASIAEYNRVAALPQSRHIGVADTAKLIRVELKAGFPGIKFSVTSKSYAGGASIRVKWFDGPTEEEVSVITHKFEGASFDGMQDLKSYHDGELNGEPVHFGADYIFTDRLYSLDFMTKAAAWYCKRFGYAMPTFQVSEHSSSAYLERDYYLADRHEYFATLFWREYRQINGKDIDALEAIQKRQDLRWRLDILSATLDTMERVRA